jgi:hypothetical protein
MHHGEFYPIEYLFLSLSKWVQYLSMAQNLETKYEDDWISYFIVELKLTCLNEWDDRYRIVSFELNRELKILFDGDIHFLLGSHSGAIT